MSNKTKVSKGSKNATPFMQYLSDKPVSPNQVVSKKKSAKKKTSSKKKSVKKKTVSKKKAVKKATKKVATKKVAKVTTNTNNKRYFLLELSGRGGDLVIYRSTDKFVDYWINRDNDLADHMSATAEVCDNLEELDDDFEYPEEFDKDSPTVDGKPLQPFFINSSVIEQELLVDVEFHTYTVEEIEIGSEIEYSHGELSWKDEYQEGVMYITKKRDDKVYQSNNHEIYERDYFIVDSKSDLDKPVPVAVTYEPQKGTFGHIVVETNGEDFDPKKLTHATFACDFISNGITEFFYDKQSLSINRDSLWTTGDGLYASVGFIEKDSLKFNRSAWIKEGFKNLEEK